MKIRNILTNALLASVLAISQNLFFVSSSNQAKAQGTTRPYVVFVNGWQNCCSWGMNALQHRLIDEMNAEPRYVPYSNFDNDGRSGNTSTDEQFLRDGADFINNRLSANRPLILIGHSFGGDSILRLLPRIRRSIQFVAVIDPVSTGGFRTTLKGYTIPNNVGYFFNRWQNNEPFPNDFTTNGSIPACFATKKCDQSSQFALTDINGKARTQKCGSLEFCKTKQVKAGHQSLPTDEWIQRVIGDRIQEQISEFRPPLVKLRNKNWGRCLNLQSATKNGVATNAWECVSHPDQEWKIEDAGNGFVKLRNKNWGRCLNLQSGDRNGIKTNAWECVSHPDQEWKIENAG